MASITSTNGFVLAGGQSRRMGRDKASMPWGRLSLLDHMLSLLSTVADPVRVVGRAEFPDRILNKGPLGGILTALEASDREANLFLAVDLPLLTPGFLRFFHSRFLASSKALLACRVGGSFPLCLGIRRSLAETAAQRVAANRLAVGAFIEDVAAEIVEETELGSLGFDARMFVNMNTPQDWPDPKLL